MIDDGSSDFDKLDESTKNEINRWNSQRVGLIQRRMQQELETKLDELDIEKIRPSKPFLRVLVTTNICKQNENSLTRNDINQAFITIWDPSPEQLDLLDIGSVVRIKNLDTKGSRYEGLRQFSGGPNTSILLLSTFLLHESRTLLQRKYTSLFFLHLHSNKSVQDASSGSTKIKSDVSVVGILLEARKHEYFDDWFVYFTDKSLLLLKIHCVNPCDKLRRFLMDSCISTDTPMVVEFRSMRVLKFDHVEQCAVVRYTRECTFCENPCSYLAESLQDWATSDDGYTSILRLRSFLNVGVQELNYYQEHQNDAIGYISGLFVLPSQPELIVRVDCGSPYLHTWRFPLALVQSLICLCNVDELCKDIVLNESEEVQLAKLRKVGLIFGSRKKLFCFKLRLASASKTCQDRNVEISHVSVVETNALAALYSVVFSN